MNPDAQQQQRYIPPSRRRDKPILSCNLCRRRKLKCDRQQPCKTCIDRGLSLSCAYSRTTANASGSSEKAPNNVHDRIDQLEKLVTTLMDAKRSGSQSSPGSAVFTSPPASYSPRRSEGGGEAEAAITNAITGAPDRVELQSDQTRYTNSGHWTSILDGIAELKEHLNDIPTTSANQDPVNVCPGPDLLFGKHRQATQQDILAGLPPRAEADQLVVKYYAFMDMAPTLLHRPTFLREYDRFWENPAETPIMWLGCLYTIFAIATRFQAMVDEFHENVVDPSQMTFSTVKMDLYREKVVQCLVLANYAKCPPYTMETFLGYFVIEYLRFRDAQFGIWLLVGMIVRTAFRMGYHREPSRFSNITPFKAEMRRRVWTMVVQLDLMSSMQVGLPRMIQSGMYDVKEPRNLTDADLDENMTELPPSRPETESTAMLYTVVRNRGLYLFARIMDFANATEQPPYNEILDLDAAIRNTYEEIPANLKGTWSNDFEPESDIAMRRLFLNFTFLKARLMLHRPYLILGRTDPKYEFSRVACLDAALELLDYQTLFERESVIGGALRMKARVWTSSWRMSSLVNHDFLLATTILSLYLDKDLAEPLPPPDPNIPRVRFKSGSATREEIIHALNNAYSTWIKASEKSREASKVAAAVKLVLGKANATENQPTTTPVSTSTVDDNEFAGQQQLPDMAMDAEATPSFFELDDSNFSVPFPMNDIPMDFGSGFSWGGLESQFSVQTFEPNLQNSYFGDFTGE